MKRLSLLKELEKHPVFNLKIAKEIMGKNSNYAKLVIHRLKKDEHVFEIEKNKYTTKKDPILVASNLIWPSYMSCWSALRYYNLTEQLPQNIHIITTRKRRKRQISFNNTKIILITIKPKYFFGYRKARYHDFDIFIADKEKALIDSAMLKKVSFSEICSILKENMKSIDTDLLTGYLLKIRNKTLIKRFGFLLSKLGIDEYEKLKKLIAYKYVPLDYALPSKGRKDKKWKVIANAEP